MVINKGFPLFKTLRCCSHPTSNFKMPTIVDFMPMHDECNHIRIIRQRQNRRLWYISLNIFYFQQITSYTVQYIQFIRKLGLERKRKLIEFFSYYRVHCDMEGGLYHINS